MAAEVDWSIRGDFVRNCSCDVGCPCDFLAPPTRHWCRGMAGMRINEGFYGDVALDGLKWAWLYDFPGPPHEGNGRILPIIDERADLAQRHALCAILEGRSGCGWFEVMAAVAPHTLPVQFAPIEFRVNRDERSAHVLILGRLETISEPLRHPNTRAPFRVVVEVSSCHESFRAETATAKVLRAIGAISFDFAGSNSSLAAVHWTSGGHRAE